MARLLPAVLVAFLVVSAAPRTHAEPAPAPAAAQKAETWWQPFTRPPLMLRTIGFAVMAGATLGVAASALVLATRFPSPVDDRLPLPLNAPIGWSMLAVSVVVGVAGLAALVVGMKLPST